MDKTVIVNSKRLEEIRKENIKRLGENYKIIRRDFFLDGNNTTFYYPMHLVEKSLPIYEDKRSFPYFWKKTPKQIDVKVENVWDYFYDENRVPIKFEKSIEANAYITTYVIEVCDCEYGETTINYPYEGSLSERMSMVRI